MHVHMTYIVRHVETTKELCVAFFSSNVNPYNAIPIFLLF